jgi:hypothetical protein
MVLLCAFMTACKIKPKEKIELLSLSHIDFESDEWTVKKKGNAHGGRFFGYCDKSSPYTTALVYELPDSVKGCFIRVSFELYAQIVKRRYGQSIVISVQNKDSLLFWNVTNVNSYTFSKNKWVKVADSIQFYHEKPFPKGTEIKVFGFNTYEKGELYIDDVNVKVKKVTFI